MNEWKRNIGMERQNKQPYVSHQPDANGDIHYSDDENAMWQALLGAHPRFCVTAI